MRPIETEADIAEALAALLEADPRLVPVAETAGPLSLRRRSGGLEGLAHVITGQQISIAAAASIWSRFRSAVDPFTAEQLLLTSEDRPVSGESQHDARHRRVMPRRLRGRGAA